MQQRFARPARVDRPAQRSRGFTLIEVMVVIVILGVLAALVVPLLLLVMGAVVLLIVLAVMQPIIEINTLMR